MQPCVYPRFALCTLRESRTCVEGWIVREWTCRKPRRKAHGGSLTEHRITGTSPMGLGAVRERFLVKPGLHLYSLPAKAERWARPGGAQRRVPSHVSSPGLGTARECLPEAMAMLAGNSQWRTAAGKQGVWP